MKAIDFACRLLYALERDELPAAAQRVLISIAAGLETCRDIARHCGIDSPTCQCSIRHLEKLELLKRLNERTPLEYGLSELGEARIRTILSFLPLEKREP